MDQVKDLLDLKRLALPPRPKVIDLKVEPYVDHHGVDSLRVWVVLDDATTSQDRTGRNLLAIDMAINDALIRAGIDWFPYTRILTPSDMKEAGITL